MPISPEYAPTSESLDNDEFHPPPAKVSEFRDAVHMFATKLKDENADDPVVEALRPGWDYLASLALASPKSEVQRAGVNSIVGLVKTALNNLGEGGLVHLDQSYGEELQHAYTPTWRFRVQLREFTLPRLVEYARGAVQRN